MTMLGICIAKKHVAKRLMVNKFLRSAVVLLMVGLSLRAQAPEGPQGGAPTPSTPAPQQSAPKQQPPQKPEQAGVTISVEVPVVTLEVVAATEHGDIIPGLKKENFRILEDGAPQTITNFGPSDAPITMVMLLEFSSRGYYQFFGYTAKFWSTALFPNLGKQDWVALETFDMRPRIEVDFTQDKNELMQGVNHLFYPGFSESNLFDAVLDTVDRLKDVKGKKSIVVLASGVDTFSKHTLDQTMKLLRQTDVTIFCVGMGKAYENFSNFTGRNTLAHMNYLQGENQLKTFAHMTGGMSWFPQMEGELPSDFQQLVAFLRHQYSITYTPSNTVTDGKFRKIKVELIAPDGGPLVVTDQKGKKQKVVVYAREGYTAPKGGVGD
jgi:VWFA-related protein